MNCVYHPVYRVCCNCGRDMERIYQRECLAPDVPLTARTIALREARELIKKHAISTWRGGLIERSDGITEVLVDFDLQFPEGKE